MEGIALKAVPIDTDVAQQLSAPKQASATGQDAADDRSRAIASAKKRAHALQPHERARNPFEHSFEVEMLSKLASLQEVRTRLSQMTPGLYRKLCMTA